SDTACGTAGQGCSVCPTDYQGYKWKCSGQACVKDTPTGGEDCTGKTGGTVACTDNSASGKCWDGTCCTGCYDTSLPRCWNYANTWDDTCGKGGEACVDCTKTSKVCENYLCETPTATGPCAGKKELDACTDGSHTGKCIAGACCTGCYYADGGTMKCQTIPNDAHCGKMGGSCTACKPYQACQGISGTCVLDMAAKFKLEASRAEIKNDPNKTWDIIGSAPPDPYLGFVLSPTPCSSTTVDKCTGKDDNTYNPVWNFNIGTYTAAELVGDHCVSIFDADGLSACSLPFETIGRCTVSFADYNLDWGYSWTFSCPNPNDSKNYVTGIRFGFTFVP
ncbi:MAG: hypothetical protein KAI47_01380, partial [Deltaproteobacteria bacterium]|nr:hypothetical protein [Deltaproteobacteria bacterium]